MSGADKQFEDAIDVVAYILGNFGGGLLGIILLSVAWSLLLRPIGSPVVRTIAASVLSLATATVLGGYVFGDGRVTDFAFSFGRYTVPQIVVLAVMVGLARRRSRAS